MPAASSGRSWPAASWSAARCRRGSGTGTARDCWPSGRCAAPERRAPPIAPGPRPVPADAASDSQAHRRQRSWDRPSAGRTPGGPRRPVRSRHGRGPEDRNEGKHVTDHPRGRERASGAGEAGEPRADRTGGAASARPRKLRALVYGDVDLNIIDGSAVWAQSMTQGLAAAGCETTLLLKAPVTTDRLVAPLASVPGVTVRQPHQERLVTDTGQRGLAPEHAVELMTRLDAEEGFDLFVVRGKRLAVAAAQDERLAGRLWTYLTDVPQTVAEMTATAVSEISDIAVSSRFLLCQTEELRGFLESAVPAACGKSVLFPPVVVTPEGVQGAGAPHEPLKLVYTGKFAPRWNTLEMTGLPAALAERGVPAQLHM